MVLGTTRLLRGLRVRRSKDYVVGLNIRVNQYKVDHLITGNGRVRWETNGCMLGAAGRPKWKLQLIVHLGSAPKAWRDVCPPSVKAPRRKRPRHDQFARTGEDGFAS
jgi:hypothetical protein